jgi:hypothetical protein
LLEVVVWWLVVLMPAFAACSSVRPQQAATSERYCHIPKLIIPFLCPHQTQDTAFKIKSELTIPDNTIHLI